MSAPLLKRYSEAMVRGNTAACISIEQENGLFGYPPELVSIGLKAIDDGMDPDEAIAAHIGDSA